MNIIRKIIVPVLMVLVILFIYIGYSTTRINEAYYRELAWETVGKDSTIIDWASADVELVKLNTESYHKSPDLSGRISHGLIFLNGGYAVRVHFRTVQDGLLGPIVLYFNPFTKQCIGAGLRY
ncbi:MAG: hypothetical protein ACOX27_02480 [Caldicoprobacterales bacterium]|jgi:hypothetical protein|nr:hypothetical protein [Clostridiales bacterium]